MTADAENRARRASTLVMAADLVTEQLAMLSEQSATDLDREGTGAVQPENSTAKDRTFRETANTNRSMYVLAMSVDPDGKWSELAKERMERLGITNDKENQSPSENDSSEDDERQDKAPSSTTF